MNHEASIFACGEMFNEVHSYTYQYRLYVYARKMIGGTERSIELAEFGTN